MALLTNRKVGKTVKTFVIFDMPKKKSVKTFYRLVKPRKGTKILFDYKIKIFSYFLIDFEISSSKGILENSAIFLK